MAILSTFASGYQRLYASDEAELRACLGENARARTGGLGTIDPSDPELHWWPSSVDFRQEAQRHREPAQPVASFQSLIDVIRRHRDLERVLWFGHGAASGELQFGAGRSLGFSGLATLRAADVSAHFVTGGTITFYACNFGQRQEFIQGIANALRVTACGFSRGVRWELQYSGSAPNRRITRRGIFGGVLPAATTCLSPQ